MDIDELYDETIRLGDVQELADRLVWMWRMTSYRVRCENGACHISESYAKTVDKTPDQTELIINFRDALLRDLGVSVRDEGTLLMAELLAVQTAKRSANIELQAPEHQWMAQRGTDAYCSCGWESAASDIEGAFADWEEHAGGGLELLPWQAAWLDQFNTTK